MTTDETAVEQVRKEKNYGMLMPREEAQVSMVYEHLGVAGAPPETLQGYEDNDTGNARRFLDVYGDDVRYCAGEKQWYICQPDMSWKVDEELLVEKLAYESVHNSYAHELQFYRAIDRFGQMKGTVSKLERGLRNIGNLSVLKSCIGMAQKEVPITADSFDRYDNLFHMPNAIFDVETLSCVANRKEYYITRTAGAEYDCEAECPRWEQFVMECVEGDIGLYRYLQKAAGYSVLTGDISEQVVFCLLGSGKNGKSLFINTLAEVAGDYACKIDSAIISMNRRGDGSSETSKELYRMRGSRFVYTGEFSKNTVLNEAFVKSITDGGKISCRPLYGASTGLTESTINANARFFEKKEDVPTQAVTMGMASIMKAKTIILLATGKAKHQAVSELLDDKITTQNPATLLKLHPNTIILVDKDAYEG